MYSEIVQEPQFYFDKSEHFYPEATTFLMVGNNIEYLYVLLHSQPFTYFFKTFYAGGGLGDSGYRYKKAFLEKLPVPKFMNTDIQKKILELIKAKPKFNDSNVNNLIYKLFDFDKTEIEEIERC